MVSRPTRIDAKSWTYRHQQWNGRCYQRQIPKGKASFPYTSMRKYSKYISRKYSTIRYKDALIILISFERSLVRNMRVFCLKSNCSQQMLSNWLVGILLILIWDTMLRLACSELICTLLVVTMIPRVWKQKLIGTALQRLSFDRWTVSVDAIIRELYCNYCVFL